MAQPLDTDGLATASTVLPVSGSSVNRRVFLTALVSLLASCKAPLLSDQTDNFTEQLSDFIFQKTGFHPDKDLLNGLVAFLSDPAIRKEFEDLARIVTINRQPVFSAKQAELESSIVSVCYSGIEHNAVLAYENALMWNAIGFTKPPGRCGPDFGHWAFEPEVNQS